MKAKTRTFLTTKSVFCSDGILRKITVYGELNEHDYVDGVIAIPCNIKGKSEPFEVSRLSEDMVFVPSLNAKYGRTKEFNMGFAICSPSDNFDQDTAIKICKRRFKDPLTTRNGRMLTPDMINAIMENELNYISGNIHLFLPKTKEKEI